MQDKGEEKYYSKDVRETMLKKSLFAGMLFAVIFSLCCDFRVFPQEKTAPQLTNIRFAKDQEQITIIFDFDRPFSYSSQVQGYYLWLNLGSCSYDKEQTKFPLDDPDLSFIELVKVSDKWQVFLPKGYYLETKIIPLANPYRLLVRMKRFYKKDYPITQGLTYQLIRQKNRTGLPIVAHILTADLRKIQVTPVLAKRNNRHRPFGLENVTSISKRVNSLAAINGSFFVWDGRPLGTLVLNRELIGFSIKNRSCLVLARNKAFIETVYTKGYFITGKHDKIEINRLNEPLHNNETALYTPAFGPATKNKKPEIVIVVKRGFVADICRQITPIPKDGYVLVARGQPAYWLSSNVKVGDAVRLDVSFQPSIDSVSHIISAGPRLIRKGIIKVESQLEDFRPDIAYGRNARSAVGIKSDGKVIFVTVDGVLRLSEEQKRQYSIYGKASCGITLEELAYFLRSLGAVEAMNLDGGGSSMMAVGNRLVNWPVCFLERPVSNALVLKKH